MDNTDDPRGLIPYIRDAAARYGINPDIAVAVAKSEGLRTFLGDQGKSGGAFQLYTGGGLGNEFQKATGLSPLDPKNEQATIDYALQQASQGGWAPWHGAKRIGLGEWDGIRTPGATQVNVPVSFGGNESPTFNALGLPVQDQKQQLPGVAAMGGGTGSLYPQFPNAPNVGFLQPPQMQRRPLDLSNIQALLPAPLPTLQSLLQRQG